MRQTIAFQATGFECTPVEVDDMDADGQVQEARNGLGGQDGDAPVPVALLTFESGSNVVLTLPLGGVDAESLMNAFTQAEPHRAEMPSNHGWEPEPSGIPDGLFWAFQPNVVGVSVTPPQQTLDGLVPHWTLAFDDEDGSQVQVAVSDAMCVQVVRALAQLSRGELHEPGGSSG